MTQTSPRSLGAFNPMGGFPLLRPAARVMQPRATLPIQAAPISVSHYLPLSPQQLLERELADAKASLSEALQALDTARAGIGEANRTHTDPVLCNGRVVMVAKPYTAERRRERRSIAFRFFNSRRALVAGARRRLLAAQVALGLAAPMRKRTRQSSLLFTIRPTINPIASVAAHAL